MLQLDAKPGCTLAMGKSGSGKTTFALRYLVAGDFTCRFLFESPKCDMHIKLGLDCAETLPELEMAIEDGFVIFNSSIMFPGDRVTAYDWFCRWSYDRAAQMPGRKILLTDEAWRACSPHSIPQALAEWVQDGRSFGMETMFATQRPNKLNGAILNEATELVCFRLQEHNALVTVSDLGAPTDEVSRLAPGMFVALNCETDSELRGRLW